MSSPAPPLPPELQSKVDATLALLRQAQREHGPLTYSNSLGAESMVLTDLLWTQLDDVDIFSLDTGRLHAQTYELVERLGHGPTPVTGPEDHTVLRLHEVLGGITGRTEKPGAERHRLGQRRTLAGKEDEHRLDDVLGLGRITGLAHGRGVHDAGMPLDQFGKRRLVTPIHIGPKELVVSAHTFRDQLAVGPVTGHREARFSGSRNQSHSRIRSSHRPGPDDAKGIGTQNRKTAGGREETDGFPSLNRTPNDDRSFEPESFALLASLRFCVRSVFTSSGSFRPRSGS